MTDTDAQQRPRYVPLSTYRLQVYGGFPLTAARDFLSALLRFDLPARFRALLFSACRLCFSAERMFAMKCSY